MADKLSRRQFLTMSAGAAALGLDGCTGPAQTCVTGPDGREICGLPQPTEAPFDTVVVLMMENRSFDHMLGWLPGANGRQAGLTYVDTAGTVASDVAHSAPDWQGCELPTTRTTPGRAAQTQLRRTVDATASSRPRRSAIASRSATTARTICRSWRRSPQNYTTVRQLLLLDDGADVAEPALPAAPATDAGRHARRLSDQRRGRVRCTISAGDLRSDAGGGQDRAVLLPSASR